MFHVLSCPRIFVPEVDINLVIVVRESATHLNLLFEGRVSRIFRIVLTEARHNKQTHTLPKGSLNIWIFVYLELALFWGKGVVLNFHCLRDLKCSEKAVSSTTEMVLVGGFAIFSNVFEIQRKSHLSNGVPQSHHSLTSYLHLQIKALNKLGSPPKFFYTIKVQRFHRCVFLDTKLVASLFPSAFLFPFEKKYFEQDLKTNRRWVRSIFFFFFFFLLENLESFTWQLPVEEKGEPFFHCVLKCPANCTSTWVLAHFRGLYICFVQLPRGFVNGCIFRTKHNKSKKNRTELPVGGKTLSCFLDFQQLWYSWS